jgi:ectoine hydroxylase-related dioxygenase (phytanoyl-CoA dioxygenase family)
MRSPLHRSFIEYADEYAREGVVVIRQALDEHQISIIENAYAEVLKRAPDVPLSGNRISIAGYSVDDAEFRAIMKDTVVPDNAGGLFQGGPVWYVGDQVLCLGGSESQRTSWHQDSAYAPYAGAKNAVIWVTFESIPAANALEVVRGSHRGATYNIFFSDASRDGVQGAYDEAEWGEPVIPNIDMERDKWQIFSTATQRGDVLAFHENAIHGGGSTSAGQIRHTMSLRFAGNDVVYAPKPPMRDKHVEEMSKRMQGERYHRAFSGLKVGEPISHGANIRQVR